MGKRIRFCIRRIIEALLLPLKQKLGGTAKSQYDIHYTRAMSDNIFKQIIENKGKHKICANHPRSIWKEGYRRCYWGFKLKQDCKQLIEERR
jgi:hypothetical protein